MGTSDWALIISLFSLLLSLAGFIWNVWSKFVFPKPRVAISFMVMHVVGSDPRQRFLSLDVTNFGPGDVTISCAVARPRKPWWKRRVALGVLNPLVDPRLPKISDGPFTGLPKKLGAGETFALYFCYIDDMFLREPLEAIGVHDSFRRAHWAPRRDFRKVLRKHGEDFPR
jgi:hypothetical protein